MFESAAQKRFERQHHARAVCTSEGTGLVLIAFVLLILTLTRHWQLIDWSWR